MKAKTLVELLTLTTNLYMISKDEDFFKHLNEMKDKGKQKFDEILHEFSGTDEEGNEVNLVQKIQEKASKAKEELELRIEELAEKVYAKMHLAHTNEIKKMQEQIDNLQRELALAEARIVHLEKK